MLSAKIVTNTSNLLPAALHLVCAERRGGFLRGEPPRPERPLHCSIPPTQVPPVSHAIASLTCRQTPRIATRSAISIWC